MHLGRGSVLTGKGDVEMDAFIMDGTKGNNTKIIHFL